MAILHAAGRAGPTSCSTTCATRRPNALGVDYESLQRDQPDAHLLPHPRLRARPPRALCRATTRPAPPSPAASGWTAGWTTAASRSGAVTSLGDTGNGFLSAIAMVQALYHRDRTGEGQFVDTSIIYAHLLNTSYGVDHAPTGPRRPSARSLDAQQLGWNALLPPLPDRRRLAVPGRARPTSTGGPCARPRTRRPRHRPPVRHRRRPQDADAELWKMLEDRLRRPAARPSGSSALDALGVPCEVSSPDFVLSLFDDPEFIERAGSPPTSSGLVGRMDRLGCSSTSPTRPAASWGPRSWSAQPPDPARGRLRRRAHRRVGRRRCGVGGRPLVRLAIESHARAGGRAYVVVARARRAVRLHICGELDEDLGDELLLGGDDGVRQPRPRRSCRRPLRVRDRAQLRGNAGSSRLAIQAGGVLRFGGAETLEIDARPLVARKDLAELRVLRTGPAHPQMS